jgi:hypothetical protein
MFCVQCGNKMDEGAKFCTMCGTHVNGGTADFLKNMQPAAERLKSATTSAANTVSQAMQSASERLSGKKYMRAVAAIISVLIIAALFAGWVSIRVRPGSFISQDDFGYSFLPGEIKSLLRSDIPFTITTHELGNYARALKSISGMISSSGYVPDEVKNGLKSASGAMAAVGFIRFMLTLCVLSFAVFLSLMSVNNKNAGIAGQTATVLTFFVSIVFVISAAVINSKLPSEVARGLSIKASVWVYISMLLGAAGFIIITLSKRVINQE